MPAFNPVSVILKKKRGEELSAEEIDLFIRGYSEGSIPDYQMSALLMAIYFRDMTPAETSRLVHTMLHSGATVDMSDIKMPKVDKHSTGGIGDKPTLILAPLLASLGIAMPTIAGRGLGHTGGTLDKMEAIPGFQVFLPLKRFKELTGSVGTCIIGQTEEICPADRKIYSLRDVTGTVDSVPLIVASIMSKKLAEGIDALVLDVKTGSGAFMRSRKEAETLARALVAAAQKAGKRASALVTDMSQPLGRAVGNAVEVNECVAFLRQGPQDTAPDARLYELTMELGIELLQHAEAVRGKKPPSASVAREILDDALKSGRAYAKFLEVVSMQGGDTEAVDAGLPVSNKEVVLTAPKKGFVGAMDAEAIGMALVELGGSRKQASDKIHPGVGFLFEKFTGEEVRKDEPIARILARDKKSGEVVREMLSRAINVENAPVTAPKLIQTRI